ncbi:MAG: DUF4149 domain-containing protein [Thermoanaerobaculia bacterium]
MLAVVSQVARFSLALWVGGTLLVILAAPVVFREVPSRDVAGRVFGEILRRFEAVKHVLSLLLVLCVFLELEETREITGRSFVAAAGIFTAVATNVYLSMVVRPRMNYCRMKVGSFEDASPGDPWKARFDRLHRRSTAVLTVGWIAAIVALGTTP